jgi:L-aminopeptidase/D-esterase-like protein
MKEININEIEGFKIGNAQDIENATGCTVILCENGACAGVDVRGGGPATRETDLLDPKNMVQQIHAVTLSGGSAFGLEASSGVMQYLSEKGIGFVLKDIYIPIVCQASLFDCSVQNAKAYPNKQMGYEACLNAEKNNPAQGNVGAGIGASVGKFLGFDKAMKSGLGHYALQIGDLKVGAIVAVNACGDIFFPNSDKPIAGIYDGTKRIFSEDAILSAYEQTVSSCGTNTTIGCIITNANLNKAQMNKIASMSHNAYARCIRPVHTSNDGDTIFAMSTSLIEADQDLVGIMAVKAMEQAIVHAGTLADSAYGLKSYKEIAGK